MSNKVTDKEKHILEHSLGYPSEKGFKPYRNHFQTDEGTADYPHCESLVKKGLMTQGKRLGMGVYWVTLEGALLVGMTEKQYEQAIS